MCANMCMSYLVLTALLPQEEASQQFEGVQIRLLHAPKIQIKVLIGALVTTAAMQKEAQRSVDRQWEFAKSLPRSSMMLRMSPHARCVRRLLCPGAHA